MNIVLSYYQIFLLAVWSLINVVAFVYMGIDKARALSNKRRVPEAHLLFLAIMFCAFGVLAGMIVFRHKIRNIYFAIGVPIVLVENFCLLYLVNWFI
jgi:uncharacterized membrane protein YsdA (DUF1294 family)